jgi:hypothetical protein
MRFLIAGVSGIAGLLCLMAVMGGFQPRLQTIIIGLVLLLVAVLVARSRRKEPRIARVSQGNQGGQGAGQTTTNVKRDAPAAGRWAMAAPGPNTDLSVLRAAQDCFADLGCGVGTRSLASIFRPR